MRILFIIIQLTLILSACAYQQGRQDQNVEEESTRQQETKPIHVKDTTQETKTMEQEQILPSILSALLKNP